jgi:tetratricopeptide (TPR) repeat protein
LKHHGWLNRLASLARAAPNDRQAIERLLEQARRERASADLDAAERCYKKALALDASRAQAHYELGTVLQASNRLDAALAHFQEALRLQPGHFDAACELAFGWSAIGDADQAEYFSRLALDINPASTLLHLHLANLLFSAGRHEEALEYNQKAVELDPVSAQARNNLGNSQKQLGRLKDALVEYRKAVELDPSLGEGHLNLGATLLEMRNLDESEPELRAAIAARPDLAEANFALAHLLAEKGEPRDAITHYRQAIALQPQSAQAHFNMALQLLLIGDYENGWREYEWRMQLPAIADFWPRFACPSWSGAQLHGESVLIYAEQGFGDAIQLIRLAPLVAARGARVLLRCRPELKRLFERMPEIVSVSGFDEPLPESNYVCPLLSLPSILGISLDTLSARMPYLFVSGEDALQWKNRLASSSPGLLKVGIAWSSDPRNQAASAKSLPWQALKPLLELPRVAFYSLQKGASAGDRAPTDAPFTDWTPELRDFGDTAALISELDLVVSIDTAVAHLAGALGKPVWTLASFPPDWRWLLDRPDSPWYPTMRLFRQRRRGDWNDVVAELARALAELGATVR